MWLRKLFPRMRPAFTADPWVFDTSVIRYSSLPSKTHPDSVAQNKGYLLFFYGFHGSLDGSGLHNLQLSRIIQDMGRRAVTLGSATISVFQNKTKQNKTNRDVLEHLTAHCL